MSLVSYFHSVWRKPLQKNDENGRHDINRGSAAKDLPNMKTTSLIRGKPSEIVQGRNTIYRVMKPQTRRSMRMLSVTDLIERSKTNYSQFFPLIDANNYRSNAMFAIHDTERRDTSEEIAAYFGGEVNKRVSVSSIISAKYTGPKPSLSSLSSIHFADVLTICEDIEEDETDLSPKESKRQEYYIREVRNILHEAESKPYVLSKSPLQPLVLSQLRENSTGFIWFSINVEHIPVSKRMKISVKEITSAGTIERDRKLDIKAKIHLSPGNFKKQTVRVVPQETNDLLTPKVYYRGISCRRLANLELSIILSQKKGFLKRPRNLHELTIPFHETVLQNVSTVLLRVPTSEL